VTQREILALLKKLQKERNLAILFITHSMELLDGFADRVVVMYAGRIIEDASARSVLKSCILIRTICVGIECASPELDGCGSNIPRSARDDSIRRSVEASAHFAERCYRDRKIARFQYTSGAGIFNDRPAVHNNNSISEPIEQVPSSA